MSTIITLPAVNLSYMHGQAKRIRDLRESTSLSQLEVANAVGVSRVSVSKWETFDEIEISGINVFKLAEIFKSHGHANATAEYILFGLESKEPKSAALRDKNHIAEQKKEYLSKEKFQRIENGGELEIIDRSKMLLSIALGFASVKKHQWKPQPSMFAIFCFKIYSMFLKNGHQPADRDVSHLMEMIRNDRPDGDGND